MKDCLLLTDVFDDFGHADGDALLASFRSRADGFRALVGWARAGERPVIYANDDRGRWDGDARAVVDRALMGPGGDVMRELAPRPADRFVLKPRYSAFDHTPLALLLHDLGIELVVLGGMATEMCVAQTAIDARELGRKVTVVTGACASTDEHLERIALEYLARVAGAHVVGDSSQLD